MMEHFGVLSSGLSSTKRLLKTEKMPPLRNYVLFPILLSPDRDPHLEVTVNLLTYPVIYLPVLKFGFISRFIT